MKIQNCVCGLSTNVTVLCDYLGNIYLKWHDTYYYLYVNTNSIQIMHLSQKIINKMKQHLVDNCHIKTNIRYGNIFPHEESLRGKAMISMKKYKNTNAFMNYSSFDDTFVERCYYSIEHNKTETDGMNENECDDELDELSDCDNDNYDLNGIYKNETLHEKIYIADFMMESIGTHDTIFIDGNIESKNVTSTIEKANGCSLIRLTIYSHGLFKVNVIGESITYYELVCNNDATNHIIFANIK